MSIHLVEAGHETVSPKDLGILLIASFALIRVALRQLLSSAGEVSIVGDADPGLDALDLARRTLPDIAIIDTQPMDAGLTGFVRRLLAVSPNLRPIILSDDGLEEGVIQAIQMGAWAYLPRDVSQGELVRAVRQVARGRMVIGCSMLPDQLMRLKELSQPHTPLQVPFSKREETVVKAMAAGYTDPQIAQDLGVSVPTVKTHVRSILRKTNSRNRTAAIATAFRVGVLS